MNTIFPDIHPRALKPPMKPDELLANLRSNVMPNYPHEIAHFTQNARHDLNLYDQLIQHIRIKRAALSREITRYESLTSPIRKLPPEVLRRIFGFAAGQSRFGDPYSGWESTAFRLSSVCCRWREIALHSSELWASMCVLLDTRAIRPVRLALSRSQQHPLSIQLFGGYVTGDDSEGPCVELLRLLVEHNRRWRELDISSVGILVLDSDLGGDNPILKSVTCSSYGLQSVSFHGDENLQSFTLDIDPDFSIEYDHFPWRIMRHLDTKYGDLHHIIECLRLGRGLLSLTYRDDQDSSETYSPSQPADENRVVSNIGILSLELSNPFTFYDLLSDIIQNVTLPSLKNLAISCQTPDRPHRTSRTFRFRHYWPGDILSDFMERSRCNLTTLALSGIPLSDSQVMSLLQLTPSLQNLTLHELWATDKGWNKDPPKKMYRTVTKTLLKQLEATSSNSDAFSFQHPLLPKLKWLTLWVQSHFDAEEAFVDLIKSRWVRYKGDLSVSYDTETLRTVELHVLNRKLSKEVYEPLKRIEENGMMITIFGDGERIV